MYFRIFIYRFFSKWVYNDTNLIIFTVHGNDLKHGACSYSETNHEISIEIV